MVENVSQKHNSKNNYFILGGAPVVTKSANIGNMLVNNKSITNSVLDKPVTPPITSNQPVVKLVKLPPSSLVPPSTNDSAVRDQEQIVEKAKQVRLYWY